MIHIIYRTCEKFKPTNGSRTSWCQNVDFKFKCLKSLVNGLKDVKNTFTVVGDSLSQNTIAKIKNIATQASIKNFDKLGNSKSLFETYNVADSFSDDESIIFFCEDDYLFTEQWARNLENFYSDVAAKITAPCFYHPTDYPDQYRNDRLRPNYIFLNKYGGWYREVDSTTCTFACRVKDYKKYANLLKDCAIRKRLGYNNRGEPIFDQSGADDGRFSEIFGHVSVTSIRDQVDKSAFCFCPLPGDACHMHEWVMSLFINWKNIFDRL